MTSISPKEEKIFIKMKNFGILYNKYELICKDCEQFYNLYTVMQNEYNKKLNMKSKAKLELQNELFELLNNISNYPEFDTYYKYMNIKILKILKYYNMLKDCDNSMFEVITEILRSHPNINIDNINDIIFPKPKKTEKVQKPSQAKPTNEEDIPSKQAKPAASADEEDIPSKQAKPAASVDEEDTPSKQVKRDKKQDSPDTNLKPKPKPKSDDKKAENSSSSTMTEKLKEKLNRPVNEKVVEEDNIEDIENDNDVNSEEDDFLQENSEN